MSMIARRHLLMPIAASIVTPALVAVAHTTPVSKPAGGQLPDRYDEPLGIGLEGWPYPAPVHFFQHTIDGQVARMAYMDIAPTASARNMTVVLLHGKTFDSSYWAGPIKDLAAAGYRVIVPDQIGFNKSSKPDIAYTIEDLVDATINLLGSLQIKETAFLGHAFGGMLAARLASIYPDRVQKLILEDPVGLVDYRLYIPPQSTEGLLVNERRQTVASYRAFVKRFFPVLSAADMEPFVEWRMRIALSSEYERFCKAAVSTYRMIYREPVRDLYHDIKVKTLMIAGEKDQSAPLRLYAKPEIAANMPTIAAAAPDVVKEMANARFVSIPNVGHVPHLEAPDIFRKAVLDFLAA